MLRHRKAQSTAEYVIVLGLIVAAVVAMQTYVKRGFQGRIKDAVDYIDQGGQEGKSVVWKSPQYDPYYFQSHFESDRNSTDNEALATGGAVNRSSTETNKRTGSQIILEPKVE